MQNKETEERSNSVVRKPRPMIGWWESWIACKVPRLCSRIIYSSYSNTPNILIKYMNYSSYSGEIFLILKVPWRVKYKTKNLIESLKLK